MNKTHGLSKTRIYRIWCKILRRCENKLDARYAYYGGRGITVCEEWHDFMIFYDWSMRNGYRDDLSIDRIDNDGPYAPWNCRWTNAKEQSNNRRSNIKVEYNGETKNLKEWAEEYGANYKLLHERYRRYGWEFEMALLTPPEDWDVTINGETHCIREWARIRGMNIGTITRRIMRGWSKEDAIMSPARTQKELTLRGETHSLNTWSKITGIKVQTLYNRIRKGWSAEEILTRPV